MPKLLLSTALVILVVLIACQGVDPSPSPTEALAPSSIAATPALIANTPVPEAATTPTPSPEPTPTERPTAAPTATPAISPVPEDPTPPAFDGRLAPLQLQDSGALLSELSDAEIACAGYLDGEVPNRTLQGPHGGRGVPGVAERGDVPSDLSSKS